MPPPTFLPHERSRASAPQGPSCSYLRPVPLRRLSFARSPISDQGVGWAASQHPARPHRPPAAPASNVVLCCPLLWATGQHPGPVTPHKGLRLQETSTKPRRPASGVPDKTCPHRPGPPHSSAASRYPGGLRAMHDPPRPSPHSPPGFAPVQRPDSGALTVPEDTSRAHWLHDGAYKLVFLRAGGGASEKDSYVAAILATPTALPALELYYIASHTRSWKHTAQ
ncbi:hypothetical protein NDU88_003745 [Pleurodeles waltl]|uniref:Uncharacterized protein n=1 Tax=Pleurodeles waltl TaxID=8319 RepID=A0AAV7LGE8_PLEWA|nr:hypothetical protein NDU88_003745 [Pleurodeles waltl]